MKICLAKECDKKQMANGYCGKHNAQIQRNGKILSRTIYDKNIIYKENDVFKMELYNKKGDIIAIATFNGPHIDVIKQYRWGLSGGYAKRSYRGKHYQLSNYVMGNFNQKYMFDHIDRNRLNNLTSNLRIVKKFQNQINRNMQSNNTTGVIGVYWDKDRNKYCAEIMTNRKKKHLGRFAKLQDAIAARRQAEAKYHGEYSPNHQEAA